MSNLWEKYRYKQSRQFERQNTLTRRNARHIMRLRRGPACGPAVRRHGMWHVYAICAVVGGTLLVCQVLFMLIGLGGDHVDIHAAHGDVAAAGAHHGGG